MISTYTSYNLISRDIGKSLARVEQQPIVARDTAYFLENITKVKTADEFVANTRLFNYAMKAFGLEDMTYAKAFMKKALNEGVRDPDSFANRLADKRYAEFVAVFDFEANGEGAMSFNMARDATMQNYTARATANGALPLTETHKQNTAYFTQHIGDVKSIDDLLSDERLLDYALRAFNIEGLELSRANLEKYLLGGVEDPESPANKHANENIAKFVAAFNFAKHGEETTSFIAPQDTTVANYMRQTLEQNAGDQNEGVRLALYFERKASGITSFFQILADPALAAVVRTVLNLPESMAQADIDKQVQMFEKRLDIEDFQDPEALGKFLRRFTSMWEINNSSAVARSPALSLISQPLQFGISPDTMMAIALMKR